tara:strand:+ start:4888 stop:5511 length:624 start_codon:yes stop_codon:yes gene_type:complete
MSTVLESSSIQPKLPIILASGSESRKQILNEAGIIFDVSVSDIDESEIKLKIGSLPHGEQVIHLAKAKAVTVSKNNLGKIVIGGDQMCVLDNKVLHKPGSKENAIKSLRQLSNQKHYQHSGVCIFKDGNCLWEYSETVELKMHDLSDAEIENYVEMENPIHAAGSYKFESLGSNLFTYVNGSSHTVRGMPLIPLLNALRNLDVISLK